MRVPLSWLREYVDFDLTPQQLADRLTALGFELQALDEIGSGLRSVVVGQLLEVAPHPNAASLSLTRVTVGGGARPLSIVCGATNIAPGQLVPVALPGAVLPGGRTIDVTRIQGSDSEGMLCSGEELGLTPDADGILILGDGARLGQPLQEVVGDVVLDLDVKPNRGDALSLIGVAREVAAITGGRVRWPDVAVPERGDSTAEHLVVEVEDERLCARFVGRYVDDVSVGPSPVEVQLRLTAAGMRPVSNVVDASNYVMLEMGKPIHTFDAAAVNGGRIIVRTARPGERLETLDHVERELTTDTLLIADREGPLGIAGVMGGAASEVRPETTAVVVESAVFDPVSIRRTAQRYALRSEASARFEKGQEPRLALLGADRTAQLIARWAGGRPAVGVVDSNPTPDEPRRVVFRPARVNRLLGSDVEPAQMRELLARLEIASEPATAGDELRVVEPDGGRPLTDAETDDAFVAIVPPHRRDIAIEADVAEEVARLHGYEQFAPRLPDTPMPPFRRDPYRLRDTLRELLAGRGLTEVVTNATIAPVDHARLGLPRVDPATLEVANPVSADHSQLRRSLLPGLLRVLVANERQRRDDVFIFEIGAIHWADSGQPVQADRLGILLSGNWLAQSWAQPARQAGVEDVKGLLEVVAARLHVASVDYRPTAALPLVEHPNRTAAVFAGPPGEEREIARVGELHPRYLSAVDARADRVAFALVDVDAVAGMRTEAPRLTQASRLPVVERDLAIVVGRDVPQTHVARLIREEAGALLGGLSLFDRYEGPPLSGSEVSLAYHLRFQPLDQPIAEGELESIVERINRRLSDELGGRLRGGEVAG